jgi:chemotaxis protein CheX
MSVLSQRAAHTPVPFDPQWRHILETATLEVFHMMLGAELQLLPDPPGQPRGEQTAMVGMAGALCGMTTIRCSSETAGKFASLMLGGDAASNKSMIGDAMGELCNMVAGNFKAKITALADQCVLSVPTVISGEDYAMHSAEPSDGVQFALDFSGATVWVALTIHA